MTYIVLTAGIDLSVGSTLALAGIVSASLVTGAHPHSVMFGLMAGLVVGVAVGAINGLLSCPALHTALCRDARHVERGAGSHLYL